MKRSLLIVALIATGCYDPTFQNGIACDPSGACPSGQICGSDNKCHLPGAVIPDAPPGDIIDAAVDAPPGGLDIDAAPMIDAAPVGCSGDADCQTAPNCYTAGTCNLDTHECTFPPLDCSSQNDQCNQGVCDTASGQCVKSPANAGFACGAGTSCPNPFGACGGSEGVCDATGVQSRTCTEFKCQAGACQPNDFTQSQSCDLSPPASCGATTGPTSCGACGGFSGVCGEHGTQTCTCTDMLCMNDACVAVPRSCTQSCTRNTFHTVCNFCSGSIPKRWCENETCVNTTCIEP